MMQGGNRLSLLALIPGRGIVKILPQGCPHKLHKHRCIDSVPGVLPVLGEEARNHF